MQHVFIVGSKGIPASYGGFETFVENLTARQQDKQICYHVSRLSDHNGTYEYNGAKCFDVKVPDIGPAKAVYYDIAALRQSIRTWEQYAKDKKKTDGERPVFYVLACRIGPFIGILKRKIKKLGGVLYVNPDGHEWKRGKWSEPIRRYWKFSERLMVKHADLLICDSKNIESYIQEEYKRYRPNTTFIAYGTDVTPSALSDDAPEYREWLDEHGLTPQGYYLVVGRFVPENNFETMIREFMASDSARDLALVTTANDELYAKLDEKLHFRSDSHIKFVGSVYDAELLKKIRENAYAYLHGHEVGGTNPSLLEALGSTQVNLLLGVGFNREVAEDAALYWTKEEGALAGLIQRTDALTEEERQALGEKAKKRIAEAYSWEKIVGEYERVLRCLYGN